MSITRSHIAVHHWVHEANFQSVSAVTADQLAIDAKMVRLHGQERWLYGAVDPATNEIHRVSPLPTTTKQAMRWFLAELHRRYQLENVLFPVDDIDHLDPVLTEDSYPV